MNNGTQGQQTPASSDAAAAGIIDDLLANTEREFGLLEKQAKIALRSRFMAEAISTDDQAITIAMIGRELGIPPMTAMREIHLIPSQGKFKPAISSHLKHALAMKKVPGFVLNVLQADERAAIVTAFRPGMKEAARFTWTAEHSRKAGLLERTRNGQPSNHEKYPVQMFLARAKAIAVDTVAPEATIGFPTVEEMRDEEHLERIAQMGTMPAVGATSGKDPSDQPADPSAPRMKSAVELASQLADCASLEELEGFRDSTKPDRMALPKQEREQLVAEWTKRFAEFGGKQGRAAAAKQATEQAATTPAPATIASNDAPKQEEKAAAAEDVDDGPSPKGKRRTPEEARADDEALERELAAEIDQLSLGTVAAAEEWQKAVKPRWKKLTGNAKSRLNNALYEVTSKLEAAEKAAANTREPGSEG